jgi:hypothetical protein
MCGSAADADADAEVEESGSSAMGGGIGGTKTKGSRQPSSRGESGRRR